MNTFQETFSMTLIFITVIIIIGCFFYVCPTTFRDVAPPLHIQHILHQSEEPFHHAKNNVSMKWFYIEPMVLNRATPFTAEPLTDHL